MLDHFYWKEPHLSMKFYDMSFSSDIILSKQY